MRFKSLIVISMTGLIFALVAGTSFAATFSPYAVGTEAGADVVPTAKALKAAKDYQYNQDLLAQIGTEAGSDVVATQKASLAAKNQQYSQHELAAIGTEAACFPM